MTDQRDAGTVTERIDRSCDVLRSAYRRRVIYALRRDGPATVGELADAVIAAGLADARDRVVAELVQRDLPKLADYGAVEYDDPESAVSLDEGVHDLEPFLEISARHELDRGRPASPDGPARPGFDGRSASW